MVTAASPLAAEEPGQFRPQPIAQPDLKGEKPKALGQPLQPADALPKSRAPRATAHRKPKAAARAKPQQRDDGSLVLNAGWELIEAPRVKADGRRLSQPGVDTAAWYDAIVPGTVLTTLVDQGVYPDPYFGLNNLAIPESLNKQDYWYRTEFVVPAEMAGRRALLEFGGINYYAEVWLNGRYLGHITGAFCRGQFDVTEWVKPGQTSVLAVMVAPPPNPGVPHEQSVKGGPGPNGGAMCLDGPTFFCTEGWDWIPGIRDRCTGIWQDVVLRSVGPVVLGDPQVITKLPPSDTTRADVDVIVEVRNLTDRPQQGTLHADVYAPEQAFRDVTNQAFRDVTNPGQYARALACLQKQPVALAAGETKRIASGPMKFQPAYLWWPNGYGTPHRYFLNVRFESGDGKNSDVKSLRFGIREITYELGLKTADGKLRRFEYAPTGVPLEDKAAVDVRRQSMLALGKAYKGISAVAVGPAGEKSPALRPLPDDPMGPFLVLRVNGQRIFCRGGNWGMDDALKRCSRQRLEPYVRMHRDANLTIIRNWCGQSTEEAFYDLCDEYGLLVWNDFWMSTENWNLPPADTRLMLGNVADVIKRYRNHPSIAVWCPRNEGIPPDEINEGIDRLVRQLDGTRYYNPQSRSVNLRGSGPWSNQPLEKYFGALAFGFTTELGACAVPTAEVVRSMMAKEDLWPPGDAWAYHDLHSKGAGDRETLMKVMRTRYGEPRDLDDFCRKAQMINYETWRAMYEGHMAKLWSPCSGVIAWMSHPSWPSVVWQFYTWDYEPGAALFAVQKASEPVHVQMNLPDHKVVVVNHGAKPLGNCEVQAVVWPLGRGPEMRKTGPPLPPGEGRGEGESTRKLASKTNVTPKANACTDVFTLKNLPKSAACCVRLLLTDANGNRLADNFYWSAAKDEQLQSLDRLPKVKLDAKTEPGLGSCKVTLTNAGTAPALMIRLTARDGKTGRRILPAYYSDNYLSLLPGESRTVRVECRVDDVREPQIDVGGWNVVPASAPMTKP